MRDTLKTLFKRALRQTPYRLVKADHSNRFQAQDELLLGLKARGFQPQHVIDGGANVGAFAQVTRRIWPSAQIHMVEPQLSCKPFLEALASKPGFSIYSVALGAEHGSVFMAADPATTSTGAHVVLAPPDGSDAARSNVIEVPVARLDALFGEIIGTADNTFLKLDLQGFELQALKGGTAISPKIEAALVEVSFFAQAYEPPIAALVRFFDEHGFDLHDIAAIAARRRDNRAHQGDFLFVNRSSALAKDTRWG